MAQAACLSTQAVSATQPRLHAVIGTFGAVQIVPCTSSQKVLVDVQGRAFDVEGFEEYGHGTVFLPLSDARQLLAELSAAVERAESVVPGQSALWSAETARHLSPVRLRRPNRRRAA